MHASAPLPEPLPRASRARVLAQGSLALHFGAAGLVLARPALWPWALAAVLTDHVVLSAAGLWPRSHLLGPNWTHLPPSAGARDVAITIDDGPDPEITPRVLDLLDAHRARATFFCIGERVARHPALAHAIVARGHGIENHTYHHPLNFSLLSPRGIAREVQGAQAAIQGATGVTPRFFRAPAGLRNLFLEPVLARSGLKLVSWTRRGFDTVNTSPETVLGKLTRHLAGRDILLLHDGHAARTAAGNAIVLEVLPRLLAVLSGARLTPVTLAAAFAPAPVRA
jgi:peptidoglycan/xylan/chitin deacetylase (PgdA/CDA1 family)